MTTASTSLCRVLWAEATRVTTCYKPAGEQWWFMYVSDPLPWTTQRRTRSWRHLCFLLIHVSWSNTSDRICRFCVWSEFVHFVEELIRLLGIKVRETFFGVPNCTNFESTRFSFCFDTNFCWESGFRNDSNFLPGRLFALCEICPFALCWFVPVPLNV